MPEAETSKAAQLIDLLLKFFANERHWLRGGYHDGHGRRCLINAVHHLGNKHGLPCDPVMSALDEALPERRVGLVIFNDQRCRSIAELRALILRARAIAIRNDEHERAAEALKRRLLREIKEERDAQSAAGDDHSDRAEQRQSAPPGTQADTGTAWLSRRSSHPACHPALPQTQRRAALLKHPVPVTSP